MKIAAQDKNTGPVAFLLVPVSILILYFSLLVQYEIYHYGVLASGAKHKTTASSACSDILECCTVLYSTVLYYTVQQFHKTTLSNGSVSQHQIGLS